MNNGIDNQLFLKIFFWFIVAVIVVLLTIGMYFIFSRLLNLSSNKKSKNFRKLIGSLNLRSNSIEDLLLSWSKKIARLNFFKKIISPDKYEKLTNEFNILNIKKNPTEHLVFSVLNGLFLLPIFLLLGLLCLLIGWSVAGLIIIGFGILLSVLITLLEYNSVDKLIVKRKKEIERELPRFISVVENTIQNNRDIIKLIEDYASEGNTPLVAELKLLLVDLNSGDYDFAFNRFTSRTNSIYITEIARGLVSTMRGDDTSTYFKMLSNRLWEDEKARLKAEQLKKPKRVKFLQFVMYACMMLLYIVVLGTVLINGFSQVFKM